MGVASYEMKNISDALPSVEEIEKQISEEKEIDL